MVKLRALEPSDLDCLYLWENNSDAMRVSLQTVPVSRKQLWDYIESYDGNLFATGQLRLMIVEEESNTSVGTVDLYGASANHLHSEVGIFISPEHRCKGYGLKALNLIAELASRNFALHSLHAIVAVGNTASIQLFTSAGFRTCGKLRSWVRMDSKFADAVIFQRLL